MNKAQNSTFWALITCDLKFVQTRSGNIYFITFVDDSTKFYYGYLLKSKHEVTEKFILYENEVEN